MPKLVLHHFDVINEEYVSGWCFNRITPWRPLRIEARVDDAAITGTCADQFRPDVQKAGLHGSGKCGFLLRIDSKKFPVDATLNITAEYGRKLLASKKISQLRNVIHNERPVVFIHIPKTAGTSFNNHVQGWFGYDRWHSHIEALSPEQQRSLLTPDRYVAGHLPLYRIQQLESGLDRLNLHTFFRDPAAQLHSHLAWIKGIGNSRGSSFFARHSSVIREMAEKMDSGSLDTPSLISRFVEQLSGFQLDFFDNIQTRYLLDHRPERIDDTSCLQAIGNLAMFRTIGLTEDYQRGLDAFATCYDCPSVVATSRHNPARTSPLFDIRNPAIREALAPLIHYDEKLYAAARSIVDGST